MIKVAGVEQELPLERVGQQRARIEFARAGGLDESLSVAGLVREQMGIGRWASALPGLSAIALQLVLSGRQGERTLIDRLPSASTMS